MRETPVLIWAQKGYFTLQMAKRVGPTGRVHSFEPDPNAQKIVTAHIRQNRCNNTTLYPFVIADVDGTRPFVVSTVIGWSSCFPNDLAQKHAAQTISVEAKALDGINIDSSRLSFIKLDAEGAEPLAIRGMQNTLKSSDACVCMEINPGSLKAAEFTVRDLEEPLLSLGYTFAAIECDRNLAFEIKPLRNLVRYIEEGGFGYVNVAVLRPERLENLIESKESIACRAPGRVPRVGLKCFQIPIHLNGAGDRPPNEHRGFRNWSSTQANC